MNGGVTGDFQNGSRWATPPQTGISGSISEVKRLLDKAGLIIDVLMSGLAIGTIYALMGLGLTLIFGVMRVTNFAQGEFYMLGGYFVFYLLTFLRLPYPVAIVLSVVALFAIGVLIEKGLLGIIYSQKITNPMEYSLIITFALSICLQKVAILLFGPYYQKTPDFIDGNLNVGMVSIPWTLVLASLVSLGLIGAVTLYIRCSWRGRAWRAIAQSPPGAQISGVPLERESALVFGLSAALAAAAGGVLAPVTLVFPSVGSSALIKGYEILAIGGLGSIPGSLAGGLILGVAESLGSVLISSAYRDFYGFALLMLFLVFRPRGLFGQA
jgi:branched-chain amino acid transport system permease protein